MLETEGKGVFRNNHCNPHHNLVSYPHFLARKIGISPEEMDRLLSHGREDPNEIIERLRRYDKKKPSEKKF